MYVNDTDANFGVAIAPQYGTNYTRGLLDQIQELAADDVKKRSLGNLKKLLFVTGSNVHMDPYETLIYLYLVYNTLDTMNRIMSRRTDRIIDPNMFSSTTFLYWLSMEVGPAAAVRAFDPTAGLKLSVIRYCAGVFGVPPEYLDPIIYNRETRGHEISLGSMKAIKPSAGHDESSRFLPYRKSAMLLEGESRIQRSLLVHSGVFMIKNPNAFATDSTIHGHSVSIRGLFTNPILTRTDERGVLKSFNREAFIDNAARLFNIGDVCNNTNLYSVQRDLRNPELRNLHSLRAVIMTLLKDVLLFCSIFSHAIVDCMNFSQTARASTVHKVKIEESRLSRYQMHVLWRYKKASIDYVRAAQRLGLSAKMNPFRGLWSFAVALDSNEHSLWFAMDVVHQTCTFVDTTMFGGTTPVSAEFSKMLNLVRSSVSPEASQSRTEVSHWRTSWNRRAEYIADLTQTLQPFFNLWMTRSTANSIHIGGGMSIKNVITSFLRWQRLQTETNIIWSYINKKPMVEMIDGVDRIPFSDELLLSAMATNPMFLAFIADLYGGVPDSALPDPSSELPWKLRCLGELATDTNRLTGTLAAQRFLRRMTERVNVVAFIRLCDSFRRKGLGDRLTIRMNSLSSIRIIEMNHGVKQTVYMYVSDDVRVDFIPPFVESVVLPYSVSFGSDVPTLVVYGDIDAWLSREKNRSSVRTVTLEFSRYSGAAKGSQVYAQLAAGRTAARFRYSTTNLREIDRKPRKLTPAFMVAMDIYCKCEGYLSVTFF